MQEDGELTLWHIQRKQSHMLWSSNGRYKTVGTYLRQNAHPDLKVENCGYFISLDNPWLADPHDDKS